MAWCQRLAPSPAPAPRHKGVNPGWPGNPAPGASNTQACPRHTASLCSLLEPPGAPSQLPGWVPAPQRQAAPPLAHSGLLEPGPYRPPVPHTHSSSLPPDLAGTGDPGQEPVSLQGLPVSTPLRADPGAAGGLVKGARAALPGGHRSRAKLRAQHCVKGSRELQGPAWQISGWDSAQPRQAVLGLAQNSLVHIVWATQPASGPSPSLPGAHPWGAAGQE